MALEIKQEVIASLYKEIKNNAEAYGYLLNPDEQFTKDLIKGLLVNEERYGYRSCPCRLSEGKLDKDRDIICPCDYRDPDLNDYGVCYCGLYVNFEIYNGSKRPTSIPERRNLSHMPDTQPGNKDTGNSSKKVSSIPFKGLMVSSGLPVWRCRVCGYLCARENPPEVCPICKVKKDRFERFI